MMMTDKERFIQIFKEKITREGSAELLNYLCSESCDFFTAPASTRYHGAEVGGLCRHSLNVYDCLVDIMNRRRMKEHLQSTKIVNLFKSQILYSSFEIVSLSVLYAVSSSWSQFLSSYSVKHHFLLH